MQNDIVNASPKPLVCYVAVGTNDVQGGTSLSSFRSSIESTLQTLLDGGVTPILLTITPRTDAYNSSVASYNAQLATAASNKNVALYDANALFLSYPDWSTYMDDAVHYQRINHVRLGVGLKSALQTALGL